MSVGDSLPAPTPLTGERPLIEDRAAPRTRFRWVILALVFFAITINYMDRMVMGILAPDLRERMHIDDRAYGTITASFAMSYALGQMVSGRWLDRVGIRFGYAVALLSWSVASMPHAVAGSHHRAVAGAPLPLAGRVRRDGSDRAGLAALLDPTLPAAA